MNWIDYAISKLDPAPEPPSPEVAAALLPLRNLMRRARGERELTLAEAVAQQPGPPDRETFARLLDEARTRVAADEAQLLGVVLDLSA